LLNVNIVLRFLSNGLGDPDFSVWFMDHLIIMSLVLSASCCNFDSISLLSSRFCNFGSFNAPIPSSVPIENVRLAGLISNLFLDAPLLAVAVVAGPRHDFKWQVAVLTTSLVYGLLARFWLAVYLALRPSSDRVKAVGRLPTKSPTAAEQRAHDEEAPILAPVGETQDEWTGDGESKGVATKFGYQPQRHPSSYTAWRSKPTEERKSKATEERKSVVAPKLPKLKKVPTKKLSTKKVVRSKSGHKENKENRGDKKHVGLRGGIIPVHRELSGTEKDMIIKHREDQSGVAFLPSQVMSSTPPPISSLPARPVVLQKDLSETEKELVNTVAQQKNQSSFKPSFVPSHLKAPIEKVVGKTDDSHDVELTRGDAGSAGDGSAWEPPASKFVRRKSQETSAGDVAEANFVKPTWKVGMYIYLFVSSLTVLPLSFFLTYTSKLLPCLAAQCNTLLPHPLRLQRRVSRAQTKAMRVVRYHQKVDLKTFACETMAATPTARQEAPLLKMPLSLELTCPSTSGEAAERGSMHAIPGFLIWNRVLRK
jgi:hypothetical protein